MFHHRCHPTAVALPRTVLLLLLLAAGVAGAGAQTAVADSLYRVRLHDGTTLVGRFESRTDSSMVLIAPSGVKSTFFAVQVKEIGPAHGRMVRGEYWQPDPNPSRLFFAPTARSVGAGSGYLGTFMLFLPFAAVGITDRITLSGGAPVLLGTLNPIYIAPKIQLVASERVNLAAGVLSVFDVGDSDTFVDDFANFGVIFGVGTFGSIDNAFTAGIGYGYTGDDVAGQPAIMLGGETRASRRVKLVTENYFVAGETGAMLSGGFRFLGDRFTADVGMMGFAGGGETFCCAPVINMSYAIGRHR